MVRETQEERNEQVRKNKEKMNKQIIQKINHTDQHDFWCKETKYIANLKMLIPKMTEVFYG